MTTIRPIPERAAVRREIALLDTLADLSVRVDEAQGELLLGFAADDVALATAAARRILSLGFLMGEACRKHEGKRTSC